MWRLVAFLLFHVAVEVWTDFVSIMSLVRSQYVAIFGQCHWSKFAPTWSLTSQLDVCKLYVRISILHAKSIFANYIS